MNKRRKQSKNYTVTKKIIRCKNKMIPVFDNDSCKDFIKREAADKDKVCKNCKHSF